MLGDTHPNYGGSKDRWKIIQMMIRKREDYGELPLQISGTIGVMARAAEKICRYRNLIRKNRVNFESMNDTLEDYFNYCLIAIDLIYKKSCAD